MVRARRNDLKNQFLCKATPGVGTYKIYNHPENFGEQILENKF